MTPEKEDLEVEVVAEDGSHVRTIRMKDPRNEFIRVWNKQAENVGSTERAALPRYNWQVMLARQLPANKTAAKQD